MASLATVKLGTTARPKEKQQPYQKKKKWLKSAVERGPTCFCLNSSQIRAPWQIQSVTRITRTHTATLPRTIYRNSITHTSYYRAGTQHNWTHIVTQNLYTADRFIHQNSIPMYKNRTHTHHTEKSRNCSSAQDYIHCKNTMYRQ